MPLRDLLLRILGKKRQYDLNQISIDANHNSIDSNQSQINHKSIEQETAEQPSIELQKDSLQLGIAAGYTGRSLREIESSLLRIESQMPTKDWFLVQFKDDIMNTLLKHEDNEQKRFEIIQNLLASMQRVATTAPEPIKTELINHIVAIQKQLPLTPKMAQLIGIVKGTKEISYSELATKLNIGEDALRGLLSNTVKRTNLIERFEKDNKGWVKYIDIDLNQSQITNQSEQI